MIEQHTIESACGEYTRDLWVLQGPAGQTQRLALFLDAEYYLQKMDVVRVLRESAAQGILPPMTCVFVSHRSNGNRHEDFICNPRYSRFIAEDVAAWTRSRDSRISESHNLICGVSLSGLAAAYTAVLYPRAFSCALCQSGSFWWLADNGVELRNTNARFWLSVGSGETETEVSHPPSGMFQRISQIEGVAVAARRLEALGGCLKHVMFTGGHDFGPWRNELAPALLWLFGEANG